MELSEAKEIVDCLRHHQLEHWIPEDVDWEEEMNIYKALDIFLDYVPNSISKDEVKRVISEINIKLDNDDFKHDMYMGTAKYEDYLCLVANRHCLEKLLGE